MKIDILKIVIVLSTFISTALAEDFSTLNNVESGVSCAPVYSSGHGSKVFFHIETLDIEDNEKLEEIKIPFAFFRYTDIAFYSFPNPEYYNSTYKSSLESRQNIYDRLVNFETNNIITKRKKYLKGILDDPNIRTGYLDYKKNKEQQIEKEFDIATSGIYCVLIAPPLDKGIKNLTIPVGYETSLGVPFEDYKRYYSTGVSVILGVLLSICLCVVLSLSGKKDGMPLWIVYYGLIPEVFIFLIAIIFDAIEINTDINSDTSQTFFFVDFLISLVLLCCLHAIFYWLPLIFSMGLGIIYLVRRGGNNGKLHELPTSLYKKANYLLLIQIIVSSASVIYCKFQDLLGIKAGLGSLEGPVKNFTAHLFVSPFWLVLSIYYCFVTKTSIQKHPSFEEPGVRARITKAFRNSFLIINFGEMLTFLIYGIGLLIKNVYIDVMSFNRLVGKIGPIKSKKISTILLREFDLSNFFAFKYLQIGHYIIFLSLFVIWYDYDQASNTKRDETKKEIDSE